MGMHALIKTLKFLLPFYRSDGKRIRGLLLLGLALTAANGILLAVIKFSLDSAFEPGKDSRLVFLVLPVAILAMRALLDYSIYVKLAMLGHRFWLEIQQKVFNQVQTTQLLTLREQNIGEVASRAFVDSSNIYPLFSVLMRIACTDIPTLGIIALIMFWYEASLALPVLLVGVVIIAIHTGLGEFVERIARRAAKDRGRLMERFIDRLTGGLITRIQGSEKYEIDGYRQRGNRLFKKLRTLEKRHGLLINTADLALALLLLAVVLMVTGRYESRSLPIGELSAAVGLLMIASRSIKGIAGVHSLMRKTLPSIERIEQVLNWPKPDPVVAGHEKFSLTKGVSVKELAFSYQGNLVLTGTSFDLPKGEIGVIVGANGSGKTTIAHLLTGLQRPVNGTIDFDDISIEDFDPDAFRSAVGMVTDKPIFFHATVRENMVLGRQQIGDEAVMEAARLVGSDVLIERLPQKLDTIIGQGGRTLSAGEGQLLALTRAMIAFSDFIILDEFSSNLDVNALQKVLGAISAIADKRTILILTHHEQAVKVGTQFFELKDGRIEPISKDKARDLAQ